MQSMKKPKRELGIRFLAGAAAVTAAIAFSSAWKGRREPVTETILDCGEKVTCPSGPVKGDNKCELRYGENDPLSKNFDPQSCGYCGDGVRQVTSDTGAAPYMDADSLIWMQNVTERPSESLENCPVEFHCGNSRLDIGTVYGAVVEDNGDFSIGTITINESCRTDSGNLCVPDCRERRHERVAERPDETPAPAWGSVLTCPSEIATESTRDIVSARSLGAGSVLGRIAGTIREKSVALRTALAVDPADDLKVLVSIRVSPAGMLTLTGLSSTCNDSPCGSHSTVMSALGLSLTGLSVGGPGRECYWTVVMRVP